MGQAAPTSKNTGAAAPGSAGKSAAVSQARGLVKFDPGLKGLEFKEMDAASAEVALPGAPVGAKLCRHVVNRGCSNPQTCPWAHPPRGLGDALSIVKAMQRAFPKHTVTAMEEGGDGAWVQG